jgi:hypothetical protein
VAISVYIEFDLVLGRRMIRTKRTPKIENKRERIAIGPRLEI